MLSNVINTDTAATADDDDDNGNNNNNNIKNNNKAMNKSTHEGEIYLTTNKDVASNM